MVDRPRQRRAGRNPVAWIRPLGFLATIRGAPAFRGRVAVDVLRKTSMISRAGGKIEAEVPFQCCRGAGVSRGVWELCNSPQINDESIEEENDDANFPDTSGPMAPLSATPETRERLARSARDERTEDDRMWPSAKHPPRHVAAVVLQALRRNDVPRPNHGCEVAIRFSSSSNPASRFAPGGMRAYLDDPSMPFYKVLGDWDEMAPGGDLEMDDGGGKACQQIRIKKERDPAWSTVTMDLVREEGCWLIERLWIDDKSVAGYAEGGRGDGSPLRPLTVAELFDEDRLEVMSCKYADYDPERLAAGGGDWLEESPNPSLSPKAVALTCILSLRQTVDGSEGGADADLGGGGVGVGEGGVFRTRSRINAGCERVIRFCSPTNVASTLTPAHFMKYLSEPWYAILKEWDELVFHSEDVSEDGQTADLVVLLRPEGEDAWTSVNWELVKCDDMWLTERIWVVDV